MNETDQPDITPSSKRRYWLPVLGLGTLLAGGAVVYEHTQTSALEQRVNQAMEANKAVAASARESEAVLQKAVAELHGEIDLTRDQANKNVALASRRVAQTTQNQAKKISAELEKVRESAAETSTAVRGITSEVGAVKSDVGSVRSDVTTVRSDVDAVKGDVATAKSDIAETRTVLQKTLGDMGVMSGLIATNGSEIQELRALGDRNIYEFKLARGSMQKVGDIQVELKKTDKSHNRFTLDVLADDKRVEKKNRGVNEPVQFYTGRVRQPYELVVNQVLKDQVIGYLSTPKVTVSRADR